MRGKKQDAIPAATSAVLTLGEIKTAVEGFDHGETNVFDALDAIIVAIEAHQVAARHERNGKRVRRDAA